MTWFKYSFTLYSKDPTLCALIRSLVGFLWHDLRNMLHPKEPSQHDPSVHWLWWQKITENIKILLTQRTIHGQSGCFASHSLCRETEDEFSSFRLYLSSSCEHNVYTLHLCDTMRSPTTAQSSTSKRHLLGSTKGFIEDFQHIQNASQRAAGLVINT